jgi:tetratricopeptide (TPR) repeat protein
VLIDLLADRSPLVRSSAAQALRENLTPQAIEALVSATRDPYRLVRIRAAAALAGVPPQSLRPDQRGSVEAAETELIASLTSRPDDALSHYNLGNYHLERGEFDRAVAAYETATRLRPDMLPPLINLAHAYNFASQPRRAEDSLRRALELVPDSAVANLNLGLLLGGQRRAREAQEALRAALAADPELAVAAYNLCVLVAESSPEEALQWCRRAVDLRPREPRYAYTLAFYLRQSGAAAEAIATLEGLLGSSRGYADAYLLLGQLYDEAGRLDDARQLYRRALDDQQLDPQVRRQLATRLQTLQ